MHDIEDLVAGYQRFKDGHYAENANVYRTLAQKGQAPKTMTISCCDSRADPSTIFDAGPGELFVLRNVANLVPPFEPHGDYHGTSAALEFAVTGLEVENILVLGHAKCGGIKAFLADHFDKSSSDGGFIFKWMSLLKAAHAETLERAADADPESQQMMLEKAAVHFSIENLKTFPFVRERLAQNRLRLIGGYFNISDGTLMTMDPDSFEFSPL